MKEGIYEQLVTTLIRSRIDKLNTNDFFIREKKIDKSEAADIITLHLSQLIRFTLSLIKDEDSITKQIQIANRVIEYLNTELNIEDRKQDIIETSGNILKAVFTKINNPISDLDAHLQKITPYTRLTHSELFTGGNAGVSLESELRKEISSSNEICLLVSFIKWKGIRILDKELKDFTENGGKLRVLTTTYMGATDAKAIDYLSNLKNTQVKVSYNNSNERLHAKAYLFIRDTGFHTGYVGSSNFSRSALTDGLEWNIKITTKEVSNVIDKFQKTFESYWHDSEFEEYNRSTSFEKLKISLSRNSNESSSFVDSFFDLKPYPFQNEILEKLTSEREIHGRWRNLVVAATGTGKTIISAFDFKRFVTQNKSSKLLFLAHKKEILEQARRTFQMVLRNHNFAELLVDGHEPSDFSNVFASVQSLNNRLASLNLSPDYYDYIVFDEVHHIKAASYRPLINYFKPKVLLGLTATPERMDGEDILPDFENRTAAEIRLPEALNRKLLCPFQYFGVTDSVDISHVRWEKGKYLESELSSLYLQSDGRVGDIIKALNKYTNDINDVIALGFCVSIEHAEYMAEKFSVSGLKAAYLTSKNSGNRTQVVRDLTNKNINYLFVVDIFSEGIDIKQIDTVLFLRPTESLTVFLQQLGRGLRLHEGKDCLTVLDFVGNSRAEYDYERKFRAMIGKSTSPVIKEIEDEFPHLPLGCSIILEKKAREIILNNIKEATAFSKKKLIKKIQNYKYESSLPLTIENFTAFYSIPIQNIYKSSGWYRLCAEAKEKADFKSDLENSVYSAISNKWMATSSYSYFTFVLQIAKKRFELNYESLSKEQQSMLLMLYYDIWKDPGLFPDIQTAIREIGKDSIMTDEIIDFLEYRINNSDFIEIDIILPFVQPLKVHARYTRDQIMAAFKLSTFEKKSNNREGVAENKELNVELLLVDLIKSEEDYSPSTYYNDYAINEILFHWQSQNKTSPNTPKGLSYIAHKSSDKRILLFVREKKVDEYGNTMGYVFLGDANFRSFEGEKPMNIVWQLNEPIPPYLWKESAKLQSG
jgi:superfamily II DNA or RNA helicase